MLCFCPLPPSRATQHLIHFLFARHEVPLRQEHTDTSSEATSEAPFICCVCLAGLQRLKGILGLSFAGHHYSICSRREQQRMASCRQSFRLQKKRHRETQNRDRDRDKGGERERERERERQRQRQRQREREAIVVLVPSEDARMMKNTGCLKPVFSSREFGMKHFSSPVWLAISCKNPKGDDKRGLSHFAPKYLSQTVVKRWMTLYDDL